MEDGLTLEDAHRQLEQLQVDVDRWMAGQIAGADRRFGAMEIELASMIERRPTPRRCFNVFEVLGLAQKEDAVSRVVCWLSDPRGSHGLGVQFLEAFLLGLLEFSPLEASDAISAAVRSHRVFLADVDREVACGTSRADIIIDLPELRLVIETKLEAREGEGQTLRYCSAFRRRPATVFVFLSPTGIESEADDFIDVPYRVMFQAMNKAMRGACPQEPRLLLQQFIKTFDRGDV